MSVIFLSGTCRLIEIKLRQYCFSVEDRPPTNRLHAFMLLWPWPWPDELAIRTWPRYSEDVPAHQHELTILRQGIQIEHYR